MLDMLGIPFSSSEISHTESFNEFHILYFPHFSNEPYSIGKDMSGYNKSHKLFMLDF